MAKKKSSGSRSHQARPIKSAPNKARRGKRPSVPQQPLQTDKGLSSQLNFRWASEVLRQSTPADIAGLLDSVGYRPPKASLNNAVAMKTEVAQRISDYLASAAGRRKVNSEIQTEIERIVETWLRSPEGQVEIERLKSVMLTEEVASDPDLLGRGCRERLSQEIDRWWRSRAGQDALEMAKQNAIRSQLRDDSSTPKTSWVDDTVRRMNEKS